MILTKIQRSTLTAALRMGGYIGWSLTVMYICEQSLHYYRDGSLLASVNVTFLTAAVITGFILVGTLLLLDFEGLLSDKLLRWLPGVIMAESGIALSLATADTMTVFSAIAGASSAMGALAIMACLLRVKVGQRMTSIGLGMCMGGVIRLLASLVLENSSRGGYVAVSVVVGVIAVLTVTCPRSEDDGGPLISLAEADPRTILSKLPYVYIVLFFCAAAFFFSHGHMDALAESKLPHNLGGYEAVSYIGYILGAVIMAMVVKMTWLPMLFVVGTGLAAAASMLACLPYFTETEAGVYAFMSFAALACIRACIYLFIIIFSLDRPHPLFYAMFGFTVATAAELFGAWLDRRIDTLEPKAYILIMLLLIPMGGALMAGGMRKYGYSQDKLDHRRIVRKLIAKKSDELELFDRERAMVEAVVLDGCGIDELSGRMLFSHNTVKVLLRPVYQKLGVTGIENMREYFNNLGDEQEKFLEQVRQVEEEKRASDRREQARQRKIAKQEQRELRQKQKEENERAIAEAAAAPDGLYEQPDNFSEQEETTVGENNEMNTNTEITAPQEDTTVQPAAEETADNETVEDESFSDSGCAPEENTEAAVSDEERKNNVDNVKTDEALSEENAPEAETKAIKNNGKGKKKRGSKNKKSGK